MGGKCSSRFPIDSSPPARGRLMNWIRLLTKQRFIPSCEGQTFFCFIFLVIYRFIPSYEGKTYMPMETAMTGTIHPLIRGADTQCLCGFQPSQTLRCAICTNVVLASSTSSICRKIRRIFIFLNDFFAFQLPSQETFRLRMI